ncbi:Protein kinase [Pseudomonas marincola]|uniref:Protein kinase n=1 Tax=Pseudomonas marincola TaxID=437900 RepID=A0A653DYZ2_9PSED|nr:SpoIIE family protein phosphatase [Pseudomonas marincola]CAE6939381.1 Protein kinase [Pseudomonas marincola]
MSIERMDHPAVTLLHGHGIDLPAQAARVRMEWMAGRQGRPPVLIVVLLWARECTDVVRNVEHYLDALFADYRCTPETWSEAQAARQVLAALNLQLFHLRQSGRMTAQINVGMLLLQAGHAQFLQAGAVGLLRYRDSQLHSLPGHDGLQLGMQAELALVQHSLPLNCGEMILLAPQPLFGVADLETLCNRFKAMQDAEQQTPESELQDLLQPLLNAPGAAALMLPQAGQSRAEDVAVAHWPAVAGATGQMLDGWTLLDECAFGPAGRVFNADDCNGRRAIVWLAEGSADEAFWQREWVLRRCLAPSLPRVLSAREPRLHAFNVYEAPAKGAVSLFDWVNSRRPLTHSQVMSIFGQLLDAVRALQRRGMQGLWLAPRNILIDAHMHVVLLPEWAAILPGVARQAFPAEAMPLAPEVRAGRTLDGRADQFALASLVYWMVAGQWPEIARPDGAGASSYVPLSQFAAHLPQGWDGVLARALAPLPAARFDALSEFQQGLLQPLKHEPIADTARYKALPVWRYALLGVLFVQLAVGLWVSVSGH